MRELLRTSDPVRLARLRALLDEQRIATFVFDEHLSSMFGGALGPIRPRLMVSDDDYRQARRVLDEIGEPVGDD